MYNLPITKYKRCLQMKDCEADEIANNSFPFITANGLAVVCQWRGSELPSRWQFTDIRMAVMKV